VKQTNGRETCFPLERGGLNEGGLTMKLDKKSSHVFIISAIVIGLVASILMGCSSQRIASMKDAQAVFPATQKPQEYFIQPGDQLEIKFFYNPELNEAVSVRPDGKISLQLVDDIQAAGLTPSQLDEFLTQKYSKELRKPVVTVIVTSFKGQVVYVGGEVNTPGLVDLKAGMTPLQAVINAGGFKETAMPEGAIVIRKDKDNQPIPVRVNLKDALYGNSSGFDIQLQSYDVVYVPMSAIAEANKFVKQYIQDLLLFRGVSLGFSYELHADDPD
jgi:protein involved in polysaccharide export with SLBB domain